MNRMKKTALMIVCLVLLQGCVHATYRAEEGKEQLDVWSLFKTVDGFYASRGDDFEIKIDKTHTQDPLKSMAQMLQMLQTMQMMQAGMMVQPATADQENADGN